MLAFDVVYLCHLRGIRLDPKDFHQIVPNLLSLSNSTKRFEANDPPHFLYDFDTFLATTVKEIKSYKSKKSESEVTSENIEDGWNLIT